MTLGTGVFLSTLVMAIVVLYGITKDRWNWGRLVKRAAVVCIGVVLLGAVAVGGAYLYRQIPITVGRATEYAGIRLGVSQDEVRYIKGYPPHVLGEELSDSEWKDFKLVIDTSKLEKGKSANDYLNWSYDEPHCNINIAFNEAKVVVAVQCYSDDKLGRCPEIAKIKDGDSEAEVLRVLGNKLQAQISGVAKVLTYPELGVQILLTQQRVYMMEVRAPGYAR